MKIIDCIHVKFNIIFYIVISLALTSIGCNASSIDWPGKVSQLNGWYGIEVKKGLRCPVCYSLIFPEKFGLKNKKQLQILTEIPRKRVEMEYDLDGPLFDDEDVLNHLMHISIKYQYPPAGKRLLYPEKYNMLIGTDTSEEIVGNYIIPLIKGYDNLRELINKDEYKYLAKIICHWSAGKRNYQASNDLIKNLNTRNYSELSRELAFYCDEEKNLMRKNGEVFKD